MHQSGNKLLKSANFKKSINRFASSSSSGGSGGARLVGVLLGTAAAGTAGVAGYASYDKDFRRCVEKAIPGSKSVLNYAIGAPEPAPIPLKELRPLQLNKDGKLTPFEPKAVTSASSLPPVIVDKKTVEKKVIVTEEKESKKVELKKELIGVKQTEPNAVTVQTATSGKIRKPKTENPYLGPDNSLDKNEKLTEELKQKLIAAEKSTKTATSAKLETIRAIEHHIQMIREAIEGGKDGDWDAVTVAHVKAKRLTAKDIEAEKDARNMVAELVAEANIGGQGETTQLNPLVPISKETARKLSNELDEMVSSVKKIDAEQIFTRDYGGLVEESRKKFMLELKAIHPELDYEEGKKLKKADLRTILAHAHLRVDQLSLKLIDLKMHEEQRVKSAIESKKAELAEKLKFEAEENAKKNLKPVKVIEIDHKKFDEELKKKIAEIQEKYDKKLEQVVKTQKQLYDIEHANDVEKAVNKQKEIYSAQIGKALAQLEGIEKALEGHLQMDIENRRSKQMWLATQNLVDTVKFGNRSKCCMEGRRAPLGDQMKTLMKCAGNDELLKLVDSSMKRVSKVKGEYTCSDLDARFAKVCRIGRRVAYINSSTGNGVLAHLMSWFNSSLTFTLPIKNEEKLNPAKETNITLLERAQLLWSQGKRLDAIRVLQLTDGATRRVAADFIEDARRHEETLFLTRLLLAHSALTSIRSTY